MEQPNLNYIDQLAEGDIEFREKFIEIIKNEFPQELIVYKNAIKELNTIAAADIVHKLKHKFNILSMKEAYSFSVIYEDELRAHKVDMDKDFQLILGNIIDYLKTI